MGDKCPIVVKHLHPFGGLEVCIEFSVANLSYVEAGKTFREAARRPCHQSESSERRYTSGDDLCAAETMRAKANWIFDETVGNPGQQETGSHKRRRNEWRRWFAGTENVGIRDQ